MPILILPPRMTPDTEAVFVAAQAAGWEALRLDSWRVSAGLNGRDVVLYGEPLFADVVAPSLGVALLHAPFDWLSGLPERYRRREVMFTTLANAREYPLPAFIKPADDKCFAARVYVSGVELPDAALFPDETPVLISQIVTWQVEYRCFVAERAVVTCCICQSENGSQAVLVNWSALMAPAPVGAADRVWLAYTRCA